MASSEELLTLFNNSAMRNKVMVATILAARAIQVEAPATANHANRLLWAKRAFRSPDALATEMWMSVLAANASYTVAQITGASPEAIQANVDETVDLFADGS